MNPLRIAVIALAVLALAAGAAGAKPRVGVTVTGDVTTTGTLTAKVKGGSAKTVKWERCTVKPKKRRCAGGMLYVIGTGATYAMQAQDVDQYVRAVAKGGAASAWKGPVKLPVQPSGTATGMQVGEYQCYSGTLLSTIWIDSATAYRSPSGTGGSYALEPGATVYSAGAVKINWTSGPYADWQAAEGFWAEYIPVGTVSPATGAPIDKPRILMTFQPGANMNWASSGWTTCDPK